MCEAGAGTGAMKKESSGATLMKTKSSGAGATLMKTKSSGAGATLMKKHCPHFKDHRHCFASSQLVILHPDKPIFRFLHKRLYLRAFN